MTRSLYTYTIAKTGGHVPRYAVRIGRRTGDGRDARETRLTLSLHDDRESAERARERARRQPDAAWRQAEIASAARERAIAERRTSPRRRGPTVIPADTVTVSVLNGRAVGEYDLPPEVVDGVVRAMMRGRMPAKTYAEGRKAS